MENIFHLKGATAAILFEQIGGVNHLKECLTTSLELMHGTIPPRNNAIVEIRKIGFP